MSSTFLHKSGPGGPQGRPLPSPTLPLTRQVNTHVRRILVVNAKGGCGKTTIATNLASYYAANDKQTALMDYDPQGSSMQWLKLRDENRESIHGIAAFQSGRGNVTRSFQLRIPEEIERVILDAPAGVQGQQLIEMVRDIDTILIPVLPSPIDIHAASNFIKDLLLVAKVRARDIRLGVVANRVRENTKVYQALKRFLESLNITFVARLRDTQNYVKAAQDGLGIYDLNQKQARGDLKAWQNIIRWLEEESLTNDPRR